MKKIISLSLFICIAMAHAEAQKPDIKYVDVFENATHPQVAYWFFTRNMMQEETYKSKIDSFAKYSKYTLIFLTERGDCNFYDTTTMHPVFEKLVAYAHKRGLQIGLQVWKRDFNIAVENTDRLIQEGELTLDKEGAADYTVMAKGAREMKTLLKNELFKVYAFRKKTDGVYDPSTLKDITAQAKAIETKDRVSLSLQAGRALSGYTAYILTQHYYNSCSNFSEQAIPVLLDVFKAYRDIPFDGIGLDEYKGLKIAQQKVLEKERDIFRERLYSLGMARQMKARTGRDMERVLFDMRYAPEGRPEIRISAINQYMNLLRFSTLPVEAAVYDLGKKMYGKNAFIGLHNTFHNNLDKDEVWQTGVSWWSIKRDYGHSDEETATPIQMGIGMSYPKNAMYNMYYGKDLTRIWTKALIDLRYGIRTHYHAANDVQGWGVSIDDPAALVRINKVENAARLLNRFDPPFPKIRLLVVYGMEAMYNWYPDPASRGMYDINDKLEMEKRSVALWQKGYLNASVPTDLIEDGRLHLNAAGKPELNGYTFDAIILLNPQYAKPATTRFFQTYVQKGGKLLLEGNATHDFMGKDISAIWKQIAGKATVIGYSLENVARLGIPANRLDDGVSNEEGSFTFTNTASLESDQPSMFRFEYKGNLYTGQYKGLAAVKLDTNGNLQKLAATGFSSLQKNGKEIFQLTKEADVFFESGKKGPKVMIADPGRSVTVKYSK